MCLKDLKKFKKSIFSKITSHSDPDIADFLNDDEPEEIYDIKVFMNGRKAPKPEAADKNQSTDFKGGSTPVTKKAEMPPSEFEDNFSFYKLKESTSARQTKEQIMAEILERARTDRGSIASVDKPELFRNRVSPEQRTDKHSPQNAPEPKIHAKSEAAPKKADRKPFIRREEKSFANEENIPHVETFVPDTASAKPAFSESSPASGAADSARSVLVAQPPEKAETIADEVRKSNVSVKEIKIKNPKKVSLRAPSEESEKEESAFPSVQGKSIIDFSTALGTNKKPRLKKSTFLNAAGGIVSYLKDRRSRSAVITFAASIVILAFTAFLAANYKIGYSVYMDGDKIGVLESTDAYYQILDEINGVLAENFGEGEKLNPVVKSYIRLVSPENFTDTATIKNNICSHSDKMFEMYVVYAGDTPVCALNTEAAAKEAISLFRALYTHGDDSVKFTTDKPITIKHELTPMTIIADVDSAAQMLNGGEKQEGAYEVKSGDTLWSIAVDFETSVDKLVSLNPDISEDTLSIGQILRVEAYTPVVQVTTTQRAEYDKTLSYETEVVETDALYRGNSEIAQKGANGKSHIVADIVKVNGLEVRRDIISETVTSAPVTQIKKVGTAEPPKGYGTGKFQAPTYGTISSYYGYRRSGFHKGIDIANSMGTPVRAADNGKVIFAGWDRTGFGYLVKINHQNGYISYYGHNSKIAVKVGQTVNKGDLIAYMGSTGNSSGPHCHFELYYNGSLVNPYKYIY